MGAERGGGGGRDGERGDQNHTPLLGERRERRVRVTQRGPSAAGDGRRDRGTRHECSRLFGAGRRDGCMDGLSSSLVPTTTYYTHWGMPAAAAVSLALRYHNGTEASAFFFNRPNAVITLKSVVCCACLLAGTLHNTPYES